MLHALYVVASTFFSFYQKGDRIMSGFGSSKNRVTVNCPHCGEALTGKGLNEDLASANAAGKLAAHIDVKHPETKDAKADGK